MCSRHAFAPAFNRVLNKPALSRLCDSSKFFYILVLKAGQKTEECLEFVQKQRSSIGMDRVLACR
jgi:hypothetical protein